jgi:hypothetical protein
MRTVLLLVVAAAGAGCAPTLWYQLEPPASRLVGERSRDIAECLNLARSRQGVALSPDEQAALGDKDTLGFIYQGRPSLSGSTFVPITSDSTLREISVNTGSREMSDRYVVCLMGKGYRWDVT